MKNLFFLIIVICFLSTIHSCTDDNEELLGQIENILPGNWTIDSFYMPAYGRGIRHNGDIIFNDTILYDVGVISIPIFSTDTLNYTLQKGSHICSYNYQNEELDFTIESITVYSQDSHDEVDYFIYLSDNITSQTNVSNWINDSRIFNDNFVLKVIDNNRVTLNDPGENKNRVLFLSKQ